ncbi:MAG: carboxypeptidase regulatory-like domain-containing protein [Flavobacteriales bacterium]|nr:carboxypeptidase regulatory-like domain-containing protein [Flavobacteriales bacterium]
MKYYLVILFTLLSFYSKSQLVSESRTNSIFTYIYQLENSEVKELLSKYHYHIPEHFFTNKIDSFYNDSGYYYRPKLPTGHYFLTKAEGNQLITELFSINSIDVKLIDNKRDLNLFVHKKGSTEALKNAKVTINNKAIYFNDKTNTYNLPKSNKKGLLVIEFDGETAFYELIREVNNFRLKRIGKKIFYSYPLRYLHYPFRFLYYKIRNGRFFYKRYYSNHKGYIAFNKPKYLPNDTLKWKAFITNKKGKPINKEIVVNLKRDYPEQLIKTETLSPVSKGAYTSQTVLGDSLKINTSYTIEIIHPKTKKILLRNEFYLEDYQLDETTYKVRSEKEHYNENEPVSIYLKGEDVNGFNILDGRVALTISTKNILSFNKDRVFVPNTLWTKELFLDPVGETKIIIPDSVFPEANIKVKVDAIFNNSNNETHHEEIYFNYTDAKKWIESTLEKDSLIVKLFEHNNQVNKDGILIGMTESDTIVNKKINFPFSEKINPFVYNYYFESNDINEIFEIHSKNSLFDCNAYKVGDSILFSFINPRRLPVQYTIFKNGNVIVEEGETIDLNKVIIDQSDKSYFINCNYIWGGDTETHEYEVHVYNKNLNIEIQQPKNIYPGQKVDVTVKVKDYKEQPVKNVNLTVGAINSQFKDTKLPTVPYNGKYRKYRPYINSYEISKKQFNSSRLITLKWINSMELKKIPYYQFIFPHDTIYYNYEPLKNLNNAQFAPFIFQNGVQILIDLMYVDDKLVYYEKSDKHHPYSFILDEGYHKIKLRTHYKEYEIDSVLIKNNFKLNLAFDADSLSDKIKVVSKKPEIIDEELNTLNQHLLFLKNIYKNSKLSLTQNNRSFNFQTSYYGNDIITIGPFNRDSIQFMVDDKFIKSFMFEPGYYYTLTKENIKLEKKAPIKPITFSYLDRDNKPFYDVIAPKKIETKNNPWDKPLESYYPSFTEMNNGTLKYQYDGDSSLCLVKLVNLDSSNRSCFYRPYHQTLYDLKPGMYQLLLISCNNTYFLIDSISILPNGVNYIKVDDMFHQVDDSTFFIKSNNLTNSSYSQNLLLPNGGGSLKGVVQDKNTGEPLPFANVVLFKDGIQIVGSMTDFDGKYSFSGISKGYYSLQVSYVGYQPTKYEGIVIRNGKITFCDISMGQGMDIEAFEIIEYEVPLISKDQTSSATSIYIDGIRVRGSANLPKSAIEYESISRMPARSASDIASTVGGILNPGPSINDFNKSIDNEKDENPLLGNNSIRNNFKDYAFWEPNLTTNEDGEASFQVVYPDNVTKWKSFAIAMDSKKHSGIGFSETKSYKNLLAQLSTPRFLIAGDQTNVIGKVTNYGGKLEPIKTSFLLNNQLISTLDTNAEYSIIQYQNITASNMDSLQIQYQIQKSDGYLDGEKRAIPIFPIGVNETIGTFNVLSNDTTINIQFNDSASTTIYAENNALTPMLNEIEELDKYPYYCMEQTASKLMGNLMKKNIYKKLNLDFHDERKIKKMITRLANGQNDDGSWGWWPNGRANVFMTCYILRALNIARENDYNVPFISSATDYLLWHLDAFEDYDLLNVIYTLSELDIEIPYANYQRKINKDSSSLYQELMILKIKQNQHLPYKLTPLLSQMKKTYLDNYYWGNDNYGLYDNSNNLTLLAYQIIEKHDSLHPYLSKIRNYFLEIKGQNKWLNTIDKAQILNTILSGLLNEYGNIQEPATLKFSGAINATVNKFPFKTTLTKGESDLTIVKNGGTPIYFTSYQNFWNNTPSVKDSLFVVKTWFEKDGKILDSLKAGELVELKVKVNSKRKGNYIMLEVPIPAGCSYGNNKYNNNYVEIHREYFKNKTNIFCEQLNTGDYTFSISLQPRFNGKYTLNPAKIELMYFPIFYGRNELKKIIIQ